MTAARASLVQRLSGLAWSRSRGSMPARTGRSPGWRAVMFVVLAAMILVARPAVGHARAAALLLRLGGTVTPALFEHDVRTESLPLADAHGPIAARVYRPVPRAFDGKPRALVLAHGVHYLGIDEPRLVGLAQSFARAGVIVLTPELGPLADYRVDDPENLAVLRASVAALAARPDVAPGGVGLVGVSFAGGLSLRVASEPEVSHSLAYVVSIGGHDDLARVARFFATDVAEAPEGPVSLRAHDYGVAVLIDEAPERFVSEDDAPQLRVVLRAYLHESYALAEAESLRLSPQGRAVYQRIARRDTKALGPAVLAALPSLATKMRDASAAGHLAAIKVPVFLLHGTHDNVVPSSESRWAAAEAASNPHVRLLVTATIGHAELDDDAGVAEQLRLVHFMAALLDS